MSCAGPTLISSQIRLMGGACAKAYGWSPKKS